MMLQKYKYGPLALVIAGLIFSGCTADPVSVAEDAAKNAADTKVNVENTSTGKSQERKRADVMGQVKSIIGNSLVIELAKMPTRDTTGSGQNATNGNMPQGGADGGPPAGGMPPEGGMPQGGTGSGGGGTGAGSNGSTGTATQRQRSFNLALTGETKEFLIPVGVSITSGMGDSAKTIDIADIEKGDVIMVYYVEGTEDIERIVVR